MNCIRKKKIINAVSVAESETINDNCTNGLVPSNQDCAESKKVVVPVVTSMTKYFFSNYRIILYTYLNRILRSGVLSQVVGIKLLNRVINKEACRFLDVSYWRIDRLNFYIDIRTQLTLSSISGRETWDGYLTVWGTVGEKKGFEFSVEDICSVSEYDRKGLIPLSPFLIPYFTANDLDCEGEAIWKEFIPEALTACSKRRAKELAEAMGLQIYYYPIHEHKSVDSILFLIEDTILVDQKDVFAGPKSIVIPPNSIVINLNNIKRDYSSFNIYHELIHYYEHYLFFRLQEMHNNDITQMKTETIEVTDEDRIENPVYWMEKQANRGSYALMMPKTDFSARLEEKRSQISVYNHQGERYEKICDELGKELCLPSFRVRVRTVQMGHVYAKGAVNYIDRERIKPFSFDPDSLCAEELTFIIDKTTSGKLFEENPDYKEILNTGKYVYVDGHIVRNDPRFVIRTNNKASLSEWAIAHVDQCCLRFVRVYVQKNAGQYVFGRMYYDSDYVKQTSFYLHDMINRRELDELEAKEQYIAEFPKNFEDAFNLLVRRNHLNRDDVAEWLYMDARTLDRWLASPDTKITADFVMFITLKLQLPDWISDLLLKRAHIQLDDENKRHLAFKYIQRVLWMDGVEKANEYLKSRKLEAITVK